MSENETQEQSTAPPQTEPGVDSTVDLADVLALVGGYHGAPYNILGPHMVNVNGEHMVAIRAFRPLDERVFVVEPESGVRTEMARIHEASFFEALFPGRSEPFPYRLIVVDAAGESFELEDPYRFPFWLTDYDLYLHAEGAFHLAYEKMGAHFRDVEGVRGVNFAVWAPNAQRVSVIGPFNGWDNRTHSMQMHENGGV